MVSCLSVLLKSAVDGAQRYCGAGMPSAYRNVGAPTPALHLRVVHRAVLHASWFAELRYKAGWKRSDEGAAGHFLIMSPVLTQPYAAAAQISLHRGPSSTC